MCDVCGAIKIMTGCLNHVMENVFHRGLLIRYGVR